MYYKAILCFLFITLVLVTSSNPSLYESAIQGIKSGLCKFKECCHEDDGSEFIRYGLGISQLERDIRNKVHGQPLITEPIIHSLTAHMKDPNPPRPLVMYFSGWTGTGKTYVAHMIARNLYKLGMDSNFVKYISSSFHFPTRIKSDLEIDVHRKNLRDMIRDTISRCERSLIILDELDKLPAGVVDVLQPMLDYVESVDGIKYNKAIFIFLTNTGATRLNALSYKMFAEGKERNDLKSKDIEELLIAESYNEPGGLRESSVLKRYSIGVFVPFLPLERKHVKLCIRDILKRSYPKQRDSDTIIEEITDEMTYFPDELQVYSKSGCKGVYEKVVNQIGPPRRKDEL